MPDMIKGSPAIPFTAGSFYIRSIFTGYVVEVLSGAMADGTWLVTYPTRTTSDGKLGPVGYFPTQLWTAVAVAAAAPYCQITSVEDANYAIAVQNGSTDTNTTVVITKTATGTVPDSQLWCLAAAPGGVGFMLASKLLPTGVDNGLVMDIESASFAPGATIKSKLISNDNTQLWVTVAYVPPQSGL